MLAPIDSFGQINDDRRTEPRVRTSLVATLRATDGAELPVMVLDVSIHGALIQTDEAPQADTGYDLTFRAFGDTYTAPVDVIRTEPRDAACLWACRMDLPEPQVDRLGRAVQAALGLSSTQVRGWDEIREDVRTPRHGEKVVVGQTPSGHVIELAAEDALEMGPEGIELFVRVVADLETM